MWSGGKRKMLKHYDSFLPTGDIKTYSEPFFGGGALFLHIIDKYELDKVYINDVNSGIIGIYRSIRDNVTEFCDLMDHYQSEFLIWDKEYRKKYFYADHVYLWYKK